ncbi:MAG: hypothetical protein PHI55_12120 [Burkholderiaceae bacterium]|nr:hypothetical protein [Burkholderiaceae bacterium]
MTAMKEGTNAQEGHLDLDISRGYFKAFGPISAPEATRITRINGFGGLQVAP